MKTFPVLLPGLDLLLLPNAIAQSQNLDADITATEQRIADRGAQITSLQAEADRVFTVAEAWRVPMAAQFTKETDGFKSTCAGKRVYGSQVDYCLSWKARVEQLIDDANSKAQDYKDEWEAAKRRVANMKAAVAQDSTLLQELKNRRALQRSSSVVETTSSPLAPGLTVRPVTNASIGTNTSEPSFGEAAAHLMKAFDSASAKLQLPKGPPKHRALASLNCKDYFRAVGQELEKSGVQAWTNDFKGLNATQIVAAIDKIATRGGNWRRISAASQRDIWQQGAGARKRRRRRGWWLIRRRKWPWVHRFRCSYSCVGRSGKFRGARSFRSRRQ